jgi:hypothetical protein
MAAGVRHCCSTRPFTAGFNYAHSELAERIARQSPKIAEDKMILRLDARPSPRLLCALGPGRELGDPQAGVHCAANRERVSLSHRSSRMGH